LLELPLNMMSIIIKCIAIFLLKLWIIVPFCPELSKFQHWFFKFLFREWKQCLSKESIVLEKAISLPCFFSCMMTWINISKLKCCSFVCDFILIFWITFLRNIYSFSLDNSLNHFEVFVFKKNRRPMVPIQNLFQCLD